MKDIVYYMAISIDGYICGKNEDISGFVAEGEGISKYLADLQSFQTVIMGRKTYEFGYRYGLQPGQLAYPHMNHFIVSETLRFENPDPSLQVISLNIDAVKTIKEESQTDVYLCGGGRLAAWMLQNQLIDTVKIKLNPFIQGEGTKLFEGLGDLFELELIDSERYNSGLQIITYRVKY